MLLNVISVLIMKYLLAPLLKLESRVVRTSKKINCIKYSRRGGLPPVYAPKENAPISHDCTLMFK